MRPRSAWPAAVLDTVSTAATAWLSQTVLADPTRWLKRIDAPTLLLWGERDAMVPFANAAEYLAALPRATPGALPGAGHLPHEEAPERSFLELLAFLKRIPG
jgi:pimeloyl-ACP methyl ester carboxylesterase